MAIQYSRSQINHILKLKQRFSKCTVIMGRDHGHPYILSTTVLSDTKLVVVLDNANIHHVAEVRNLIETWAGSKLLFFLPPYSPDLNPAEGVFSQVKKKNDHLFQVYSAPHALIAVAFSVVSVCLYFDFLRTLMMA